MALYVRLLALEIGLDSLSRRFTHREAIRAASLPRAFEKCFNLVDKQKPLIQSVVNKCDSLCLTNFSRWHIVFSI